MRKFNLTTQAFISSIISIVLCLVMLMGTTFAWYTDGVSVDVDKIQAGEFEEETTTQKETTTEKKPSTEQESTTKTTTNPTTQSTTAETTTQSTTAETTTQSTTAETTTQATTTEPSSTEPTTAESATETTESTTAEVVTESTTAETIVESTTEAAQNEFPIIVEGEEYNEGSELAVEDKEVDAESVVIVKKSIDTIVLAGITADVDNGIVIEKDADVKNITFGNCDFTLVSGGKLVVKTGTK